MTIKLVIEDIGFESLDSDICLFYHKELGILVVLYVDDLLVAAKTIALISRVQDRLARVYKLKELEEVKRFLSFNVVRDRSARKIFISQESYLTAFLARKDITNCHLATTS